MENVGLTDDFFRDDTQEKTSQNYSNSAKIARQHRERMFTYRMRRRRTMRNNVALIISSMSAEKPRSVWAHPRQIWWQRNEPLNIHLWPNSMFLENLRMSKVTFYQLLKEIGPYIAKKETNFRKPVPTANRLAITIWRLATNIEYRSLGHLFCIGTSTTGHIVRECCMAIQTHLLPKYVAIAKGQQFLDILHGFEDVWGFPHCFGAIDGSHIPIIAPSSDHCDYFNRKGCHSLILQALVDYRYMFLDINVGWSGSVHDARVLGNSSLFINCENGTGFDKVKRNIGGIEMYPVIIGDAAYPLMPWLIKPFRETADSPTDIKQFNYRLSRARMVVENAFGRLKGRFRLLKKQCDCDIDTTVSMVSAAVTLHNYCELKKETFDGKWLEEEEDDIPMVMRTDEVVENDDEPIVHTTDGKSIRLSLVTYTTENPL